MDIGTERLEVLAGDGRRLDVLVSGEREQPAVVFHGGTPNGLVPLPAQFTEGVSCRSVLYARPGYCGSSPNSGRSVGDAAADVAAILDALGIDTFMTVGWSGGGPHALACAALLPERCTATAVVAGLAPPQARVQDWSDDKLGMAMRGEHDRLIAALSEDRAGSDGLRVEDLAHVFTSQADRAALSGDYAQWLVDYLKSADAAGIEGAREDWLALAGDWGFNLELARHVTLWHGDRDDRVTTANAAWLANHIPNSTMHVLAGDGHLSIARHFPAIYRDLLGAR